MTVPFDLLVVGDANPDVVLHGAPEKLAYGQAEQLVESGTLTVGGSAGIMACAAARLGLRTAFASVVGGDAAGRFMLDELGRRGVDVSGRRRPRRPRHGAYRGPGARRRPRHRHLRRLHRRAHGGHCGRRARARRAPRARELVLPAAGAGAGPARPLRGRAHRRRRHLARPELGPGAGVGRRIGGRAARRRRALRQRRRGGRRERRVRPGRGGDGPGGPGSAAGDQARRGRRPGARRLPAGARLRRRR